MEELRSIPGNERCADCGAPAPKWVSLNLGVFLCIQCAGVHRNMGVHVSQMRSVLMDVISPEEVKSLGELGNNKVNASMEKHLAPGQKLEEADGDEVRQKYIHAKYIDKAFTSEAGRDLHIRAGATGSAKKTNATTEYIGILIVHVLEGADLVAADFMTSDPYVILQVGMQKMTSKVIRKTVNPVWNETLQVCVPSLTEPLLLTVMDKDDLSKDDFIGRAQVDISSVKEGQDVDKWVSLEGVKTGRIHLRLSYASITH